MWCLGVIVLEFVKQVVGGVGWLPVLAPVAEAVFKNDVDALALFAYIVDLGVFAEAAANRVDGLLDVALEVFYCRTKS